MTKPPSDRNYVPALGYHWLTPYYDRVVGISSREKFLKRVLIQQMGLEAEQLILDLACGTGTLAILIKATMPSANVIAVDCDRVMLSLAERKANQAEIVVEFDQAFSDYLPYPDAHFDRVVSSLFFHHLTWENKKRTINEIYRILKPGGELHVADWGPASNIIMRGLFLFVQLIDGFRNTQDNVSGRLAKLFEQAGFAKVTEQQSFNTIFGTLVLYRAVKRR